MKNVIWFKFDIPSIKNFVYFLNNNTKYEKVYFIPIKSRVFFISPSRDSVYLTISDENSKINTLKVDIQNNVNNGRTNFKHVFAVKKSELKQFLKLANRNNHEFYFNLTDEGDSIKGGCSIWRNKMVVEEAELRFQGKVQPMTSDDYELQIILNFLLNGNFNFEEIDFSKSGLNIELKYYSAIEKCIDSYKDYAIHVSLSADKTNRLTNVSIYADNGIDVYFSQIIIAQGKKNDFSIYRKNNDILTYFRKSLNIFDAEYK